jgi:hypothetical protein
MGQWLSDLLGLANYQDQVEEMKTFDRETTTVSALHVTTIDGVRSEYTTLVNLDLTALQVDRQVLIQFAVQRLDGSGHLDVPVMRQCNAIIVSSHRLNSHHRLQCRSLFIRDEGVFQSHCHIAKADFSFDIEIAVDGDTVTCWLLLSDAVKAALVPTPELLLTLTNE